MKLVGHSSVSYTQAIFPVGKKHLERLGGRERYFDPSHVSEMSAWYKADAIVGFNEGDPLDTWSDSSGNGHTMTQSNAVNKPTYHASGAGANSLPCVEFPLEGSYYMNATDIIIGDAAPITFAMYVKSPYDTTNYIVSFAGDVFQIKAQATARSLTAANWSGNSEYDITDNWRSGFGCNDAAKKKPFFKNGFYLQYDNYFGANANANIASGTWTLGRCSLDYMQGFIAELIIYNAIVDPYVYAPLFHQYFVRKYGAIAVYS